MVAPVRILSIALALIVLSACGSQSSQQLPQPVTLNADDYRTEITDIDRLVFSPKAYDETRRNQLAAKLQGLASRVAAGSDSRFLAGQAYEIKRLADVAKHTSASAPRDHLQKNWMRIRNNLFEDRYWMARSAADVQSE
jgi:hypothetical protein